MKPSEPFDNPRKFTEKIAMHTNKQKQETAEFEALMQDLHSRSPQNENNSPRSQPFEFSASSPKSSLRHTHAEKTKLASANILRRNMSSRKKPQRHFLHRNFESRGLRSDFCDVARTHSEHTLPKNTRIEDPNFYTSSLGYQSFYQNQYFFPENTSSPNWPETHYPMSIPQYPQRFYLPSLPQGRPMSETNSKNYKVYPRNFTDSAIFDSYSPLKKQIGKSKLFFDELSTTSFKQPNESIPKYYVDSANQNSNQSKTRSFYSDNMSSSYGTVNSNQSFYGYGCTSYNVIPATNMEEESIFDPLIKGTEEFYLKKNITSDGCQEDIYTLGTKR